MEGPKVFEKYCQKAESESPNFMKRYIDCFLMTEGSTNIPEKSNLATVWVFPINGHLSNFNWVAFVRPCSSVVIAIFEDKISLGIYLHTEYEETWPSKGYEVQVNCTHGDPVKNGSLWGVVKAYEPNASDDEWFTMQITVQGKNIVTRVNGKIVVDYTELAGVTASRRIDKGSIAFQAHDPKSVVRYRNVKVRELD